MLGYLNNPSATADTIDSEGWMHTGDLATYRDGCVYIKKDRMKDIIKVTGFQARDIVISIIFL